VSICFALCVNEMQDWLHSYTLKISSICSDSVMAIGIGACKKQISDRENPPRPRVYDDGPPSDFEAGAGFIFTESGIVSPTTAPSDKNIPLVASDEATLSPVGAVAPTEERTVSQPVVPGGSTSTNAPDGPLATKSPVTGSPAVTPVTRAPVGAPVAESPMAAVVPVADAPVETPVIDSLIVTPVARAPGDAPVADSPTAAVVPVAVAPVGAPVIDSPFVTPVAKAPVETPVTAPVQTPATGSPIVTPGMEVQPPITGPVTATPVKAPVDPLETGSPASTPVVPSSPDLIPSDSPTAEMNTPTVLKSIEPSHAPTVTHSDVPLIELSNEPSLVPTITHPDAALNMPSGYPVQKASNSPSTDPDVAHSGHPSAAPSLAPTVAHSDSPMIEPSGFLVQKPSFMPSGEPSLISTKMHSDIPSLEPNESTSNGPSFQPSASPFVIISALPSTEPSSLPSAAPAMKHSDTPSAEPSGAPPRKPSTMPSSIPTIMHSDLPSIKLSATPSDAPTIMHSDVPSVKPSNLPSSVPSMKPSQSPSIKPSGMPSDVPTIMHSDGPSIEPSNLPSESPSIEPSMRPSDAPTIMHSDVPSFAPSNLPSLVPSTKPSQLPSTEPSTMPSDVPTVLHPSIQPSQFPSSKPSTMPSDVPTVLHSTVPSIGPSNLPSLVPSIYPSGAPSLVPSNAPSTADVPSGAPSSVTAVSDAVLFVVADSESLSFQELTKTFSMISWGFAVDHISADANATEYESMLATSDVVFVGEEVPMGIVGPMLFDESIGIVVEKAHLVSEFGFAGNFSTVNTTSMDITNNAHYITKGFDLGPLPMFGLFGDRFDNLVSLADYDLLEANILGKAPVTGGASLVIFAKNDTLMEEEFAQGRRVFLPWGGEPGFSILDLSFEAWEILQRSLRWGAGHGKDHSPTPPPSPPPPPPTGRTLRTSILQLDMGDSTSETLLSAILKSSFQGASGTVEFGKETVKGRNSNTITVGVFNIQPLEVNQDTGRRSYRATLVGVKEEGSTWQNVPNTTLVYRDGTLIPSGVLRRIQKTNYISHSVRVTGLALMCMSLLVAFVAITLLLWLQKDPIVQRAQPVFMLILCAGSAIMSMAIFTLSFDEGAGWTNKQLSVACSLTPWLFFTGQILVFCALFTKLYRLDKVLQFRPSAVTMYSALWPLLTFVALTLAVLAAHSIYDPWSWVTVTIKEIPSETYGECTSKHQWMFFGLLMGLMIISELLTMFFAWKTVDAPEDFRDSGAVMYACFVQIQAWSIGVPMLAALGRTSSDATYFARILLIFIFAVSSVVVVVSPKVIRAITVRRNPSLQEAKGRVKVSGLYQASGSIASMANSMDFSFAQSSFQMNSKASSTVNPSPSSKYS